MSKQVMDESFSIDAEWRRINREREIFKARDEELYKETDDYNREVDLVNRKGGNDEDVRRMDQWLAAKKEKEALLEESKCRLLYDIDEVNRRSEAFNRLSLPSGVNPKKVIRVEMSSNGKRLYPQVYKKGEPLHAVVSKNISSSSASSDNSTSPPKSKTKTSASTGSLPKSKTKTSASTGSANTAAPKAKAKARSSSNPKTIVKTKNTTTSISTSSSSSNSTPQAVQSRSFVARGGGASDPLHNLVDESRLIDQEWARIEREDQRFASEDRRLEDESDRLNDRIHQVNLMMYNKKQLAEVDSRRKWIDGEYAALDEQKRRLLYDIERYNQRVQAYNGAVKGTELKQKAQQWITYSRNKQELTPLSY